MARHRAPRPTHPITAPLAVAALAATTGPLALAGCANAATPTVDWSKVAACESSGDWSINTGNGYYGGLQFSASTWAAYGGLAYAPTAAHATEAQQVTIAERVLAGQGIGAWPVCGPKGVISGTTSTPVPSRVAPTPAPSTTPVPAPAPHAAPPVTAPRRYVVRAGDTLSGIAATYEVPGGYRALADTNAIRDVNMIFPNEVINLPSIQPPGPRLSVPATPPPAPRPVVSAVTPTATVTAVAAVRPTVGASVVATARGWVGTPYRWGGTTRAGVDCSGLVQAVFRANGIVLPRTADAQLHAVTPISRAAVRPGDLVFRLDGGHAYHVGIVVDAGHMIDAPDVGQTVGVHALPSGAVAFGRAT